MQMKCFCKSELFKVYKVGHQFLLVCPTCKCERTITSPGVKVRVYEPSVPFEEEALKSSEVMYCAGTEDQAGNVGMWAGPTPDINDLLKCTPDDFAKGGTSYIIEYDNDNKNHRNIFRWDSENFSWVEIYEPANLADLDKIPHG